MYYFSLPEADWLIAGCSSQKKIRKCIFWKTFNCKFSFNFSHFIATSIKTNVFSSLFLVPLPGPVPVIPPTFQSVRVSNKCLKCRKAMSALQKAENLDCIALGYLKPNLCDCVSFCLSVMSYITSSLKSNTHIHTLHESDRACMSCLKYLAAVCSIWSASCQRGLACLSFSVFSLTGWWVPVE